MGLARICLAVALGVAGSGVAIEAAPAAAADTVSISIEKHARLSSDGSPIFFVRVTCGPLPGSPDFREGFAGARQKKTGAEAEGGLSPDLVCDGVERVYTAGVSVITDERFRRGPARASASVIACNVVGDEQVCESDSAERRIIIRGRAT